MIALVLAATPDFQLAAAPILPTKVPTDLIAADPFRQVGLVRTDSFGDDPTVLGSGWVAGERVVASAAHVFFVDETLGWNRNRWYWKRAAYPDQFWNTHDMLQPRSYRVLAGYAGAVADALADPLKQDLAFNRDAIALMFYRAASNGAPLPRATDALGGTGTYSIVGYPVKLGGLEVAGIHMHAHMGGLPATFALAEEGEELGGWKNAFYETHDITSGPGGSGGPVLKMISGEWAVVGSLVAGIDNVSSFSRGIDEDMEAMLAGAITDSVIAGPGQLLWEVTNTWSANPVIRADGSIVVAMSTDRVAAFNASGDEIWSREVPNVVLWLAEAPDGRILVGSYYLLIALDGQTGRFLWQSHNGGFSKRGAVGEIGETYVAGELYLARISPTGSMDWTVTLPYENIHNSIDTAPSVGPDGTIFMVSQDRVYALNPTDGSVKWRTAPIAGVNYESLSAGIDGSLTISKYSELVRLEPDGSVKWTYSDTERHVGRFLVRGDGSIVAARGDNRGIVALKADGTVEKSIDMDYGVESVTADDAGNIYVGTSTGVVAFDPAGMQLWRNDAVVREVFLGHANFLLGSASRTEVYAPPGWSALGTYAGAPSDIWQPKVGGANGARRVANSLPQAPRIVVPPANTDVVIGYRLELKVAAEGSFPMTFEWRRNGMLLPEQIGQRMSLPTTTEADSGDYTVTVRNAAGEVTSTTATVLVRSARFGDELWKTELDTPTSPAVAEDGTVYVVAKEEILGDPYRANFSLVALSSLGSEEWRVPLGVHDANYSGRPPVVGDDGRIYSGAPGRIWAFSKNGAELWHHEVLITSTSDWPVLVLARDNGVFYRTSDFLGCIRPDGVQRWQRSDLDAYGLQVRRDGKLVVGTGRVVSPEGVLEVLGTEIDGQGRFGFLGPDDEWILTVPYDGGVTANRDGVVVSRNPDSIYDLPLFMMRDGTVVTDRLRLEPFMGVGTTFLTQPGYGKMLGVLQGDRILWTFGDDRIAALDRTGKVLVEADGVRGYEFTITSDGVLVGGNPLSAHKLDWGRSRSPWPVPLADARNTNQAPIEFEMEQAALESVVIRGRLDPIDPYQTHVPYHDSTMQAFVGYGAGLVASVYGSGPLTFHWSKDGQPLDGVTGGELRFDSPRLSNAGSYTVSVTNDAGTTYSEAFTLIVSPPAPITPGTYVRMWTDPFTSESWPLLFKVTGDRQIEFNLFNSYGVQGKTRIHPDGKFYRVGNNYAEFSGSVAGSTLTLNGYAPLAAPPSSITGVAGNGIPAGIYQGHALGRTGFRVLMVVFADGTFSWLQGTGSTFSTSARGLFAGTARTTNLMVPGSGSIAEYAVTADPTGALVGHISVHSSHTQSEGLTGFAATWTGRPEIERFANLSTRGYVTADQPPMIAGFFFEGPTNHSFLLRAVGPALAQFDIQNPLAKPRLRLMSPQGSELRSCTAWRLDPEWLQVQSAAARLGAFAFAETDIDSAIHSTLSPGGYTMLVDDVSGGAGIALVEVYEDRAASGDASRLRNLSTRGNVGRGERVLVGGFYIGGTVPKSVLIRAAGPTLAHYSQGLFNTASDPRLTIYKADDPHNPIASNDDYWLGGNEPEVRAAAGRVGAFEFLMGSKDAALVLALPPGGYTAVVDNVTPEEGVALLEIYEIPSR